MNIFAAIALVALGVALSEIYAAIRLRAERAAYGRGYKQAKQEQEICAQYAIMVPRRMDDWQICALQPGAMIPPYNYDLANVPHEPVQINQSFMDHMHRNGQATLWMNKKEC